ncbi:Carboxylesterase A [Tolypocladium paradoxum]|uniref:Carboxylesterase A n=1 Tax=Tolypocladium paradoxum TaxID=94208 RepID=A0A2S4KZ52_9HYPO|nr:Carboxylesterase A [Tolypocladium paradoxum]
MPQETAAEPDAFPGIMCSDSRALDSLEDTQGAKPTWRFATGEIKADTDYPILYMGNVADNVTPLASAYNNAAHFPSSAVLVQKSYGVTLSPLPHPSLRALADCRASTAPSPRRRPARPGTSGRRHAARRGNRVRAGHGLFDMPAPGDVDVLGRRDELARAVYEPARKAEIVIHFTLRDLPGGSYSLLSRNEGGV